MAEDSQYVNLVKMYNLVQDQINDLKEQVDNIKEDMAKLMHEDSVNEKLVTVDEIKFRIFYQGRTSKKVDHDVLFNMLGPNKYQEVVTESHSEFLSVRKAPKGQQTSLAHSAPNKTKKTLIPPSGTLA